MKPACRRRLRTRSPPTPRPESATADATVTAFTAAQWRDACAPFLDRSLIQTWTYGEAKAAGGPWLVERGRIRTGERTLGLFQAFIRHLPAGLPGGLAWINRGPLWRTDAAAPASDLALALAALKRHYVDQRGFYLRVAPPVEAAVPDSGLRDTGMPGWASARLDLRPDAAALRKGLRQKWRNGLNRGEREGLDIRRDGAEAFEAFLAAHDAFLAEAGFAATVTGAFLRSLRERAADIALDALVAFKDGRFVGGALIVDYGETAEYLAGNTTEEGRALNAGQVLLWQAAVAAKERGRAWFDLGGLDDVLTPPGIFRFKEGLGGAAYRLSPEREAVPCHGIGALTGRLVRARAERARQTGAPA